MAKRCTNCGNFLMDDERFCSRCGENVGTDPVDGNEQHFQTAAANTVNANTPNNNVHAQNYIPPNAYAPIPAPKNMTEMTLGQWVGTIVVTTMLGIISIIFLFIWGFGDGPESRKNYCKAMLIVTAIGVVISILLIAIFSRIFMSLLRDYIYYYR